MRFQPSLIAFAALGATACATAAVVSAPLVSPPLSEWAGAYGRPQPPFPDVDSSDDAPDPNWKGEDEIVIRPTGPASADISAMLFFPYGHQCAVNGPASLENGKLVYREATEWGPCQLSVFPETNKAGERVITLHEDLEGRVCSMIYCGARGVLGVSIPAATRHPAPPVEPE